ncbi:MAG: glycosyltransferase family 4 protein [Desulfobacterales bacterium]|nr:glycosyltransferase family 4 protein [Desulfobacterales bacterium]
MNTGTHPKIDLIFLHPHFTLPGGAGNAVIEAASRLNPERYNVRIICIRADSDYKNRYPALCFIEIGGPLSSSPMFWLTFPWVQYKIHSELNRFSPGIIIPNVLPANWWGFIYKLFHKEVLCLWYCHEPSAFIHIPQWIESITHPFIRIGAKLLNPLLKAVDLFLVSKGPDHVVSNSRFSSRLFEKVYHRHVADYLYPGIDLEYFSPQADKKKYLLMVSRLTKFKNVHIAIQAMSEVKDKAYRLVIGGEGEEKDNLMALTKSLNLTDRVHFIGRVADNDLPKLYAEAKLVLFTSREEPFGMVPVEALVCGTPVIGAGSGGLTETIAHNYNGILLDEMTAENLADAVNALLSDNKKYELLQKHTRETAEEFGWDRHVKTLESILEDLMRRDQKGTYREKNVD